MNKIKDLLKEIIDELAESGFSFSNEQDFQFQLGVRIMKNKEKFKNVYFEACSIDKAKKKLLQSIFKQKTKIKKSDLKKEYTDLVIETNNGEFIAIELKYKAPNKICFYETDKSKNYTMAQGAYDIGACSLIHDISRLEMINKRSFINENIKKINQAFVILLTNDKNYRFNGLSKLWENYSINENKKKIPSGCLNFKGAKKSYPSYLPITLKNTYALKWYDYNLKKANSNEEYLDYEDKKKSNSPGYSFLIIKVK